MLSSVPLASPVLANGATRPEHSGMLSFQRPGLTWLTALALTAASPLLAVRTRNAQRLARAPAVPSRHGACSRPMVAPLSK